MFCRASIAACSLSGIIRATMVMQEKLQTAMLHILIRFRVKRHPYPENAQNNSDI